MAALKANKYSCSTDEAYERCTQGTTSVQVLLGDHPRPPVLSLQASGAPAEATTKLAAVAPQVLEIAHVNPRQPIVDWLNKLEGKPAGSTKAGNWTIDFSTESSSEAPGAILTLTDTLCKTRCGAE
ncbi:hypothetical protein [Kribbella sp. NPDC048915]|uniref:hypothetical protein n=1 Tax=Kribbella sp. NPDC048915 TaxID=3155148 RepID=UPI0033E6D639